MTKYHFTKLLHHEKHSSFLLFGRFDHTCISRKDSLISRQAHPNPASAYWQKKYYLDREARVNYSKLAESKYIFKINDKNELKFYVWEKVVLSLWK